MTWMVIGVSGALALILFSPFIVSSRISRAERAERDRNGLL